MHKTNCMQSIEHISKWEVFSSIVGPQNAPLHNMLLLVAYCVPCIHNMLRWSILCTLHTQYATSGAYCVGSIHMLFQWSSEGTQYAPFSSILCTLHTQYAPLEHFVYPAYTICFQWSILCRVDTYVISVVVRGYTICSS